MCTLPVRPLKLPDFKTNLDGCNSECLLETPLHMEECYAINKRHANKVKGGAPGPWELHWEVRPGERRTPSAPEFLKKNPV